MNTFIYQLFVYIHIKNNLSMSNQNLFNITKADCNVDEANKLINSISFFTSKSDRYEKAIELLSKARDTYKHNKMWTQAIESQEKIYDLHKKLKDNINYVIPALVEIAKLYKNIDQRKAIETFKIAIDLYNNDGKYFNAAKLWKEIIDLLCPGDPTQYFTTDDEYEELLNASKCAIDLLVVSNESFSVNKMKINIAIFNMHLKKYTDAIIAFEEVSKYYMEKELAFQLYAIEYLSKCIICLMANSHTYTTQDINLIEEKLNYYCELLPQLDRTREKEFLTMLIKSIRDNDLVAFTNAVSKYDQVKKLDPLTIRILLVVKENIKNTIDDDNIDDLI